MGEQKNISVDSAFKTASSVYNSKTGPPDYAHGPKKPAVDPFYNLSQGSIETGAKLKPDRTHSKLNLHVPSSNPHLDTSKVTLKSMIHITVKDMSPIKLLPMVHCKVHIPMTHSNPNMTHAKHIQNLLVDDRQTQVRTCPRLSLVLLRL
ncbi:uncharacterized protein J4E84_010459 [Alternaria hordeiaustralica]|uniref:uncharacterized protein n=1 Tax=Alternaria hordeiaustralica TaxID=1187925 RepID=UPI0020C42267|nr:uncharacterized protein J4E84_010459 [Alternaria hordeiaustralica]KAI4674718.1 hypothetical protein J4E84_010459 [Alternaria hordeiaustralica]